MLKNTVKAATLSSLDASGLTGSFQAFTALPAACFLVRITNTSTDRTVTISLDGVNDHDVVPFGQSINLPLQSNNSPNNHVALLPKGLVIYAKGTGGGSAGNISLAAYYQTS